MYDERDNKDKAELGFSIKTNIQDTELVPFEIQLPHTEELHASHHTCRTQVTIHTSINGLEIRDAESMEFKVLIVGRKRVKKEILKKEILTLKDLKKEKKILEDQIVNLITAFQVKYGVGFKDINTTTEQTSGDVTIINKLNVELKL